MPDPNSPCGQPPEASSFLRRPEELRSFLDDIIRVASRAISLLESCRGPLEACNSCAQPPPSRSPRRLYSFCFFCGQNGHIRANCDSCKEYLAAGKCLLVNGRVVLPTGQEIPREVPRRTLKDHLACWDLGNRSKDMWIPPPSPGWLPLEDVGSQMPQTQRVSLGVSQPRLLVHPNTPSAQPLCAPLSAEGPSYHSVPAQPEVSIRTPSASSNSSDTSLCRPHSPTRVLSTGYSRGRPHSRSHSRSRSCSRSCGRGRPHSPSRSYLESPPSRGYRRLRSRSSRSHSHDSHDSRDYYPHRSPPPALSLAYSRLLARLREEPTLVRQLDRVVTTSTYSSRPSQSSWEPAHSRRQYSRSRTPQPSRREY